MKDETITEEAKGWETRREKRKPEKKSNYEDKKKQCVTSTRIKETKGKER